MEKYSNVVTNTRGVAVAGASVLVTQYPSGAPATIYLTDGGSPTTAPITTGANGAFSFYAADGHYSLTISGVGITTYTLQDILLGDVSSLSSPSGASKVGWVQVANAARARTVSSRLAEYISIYDFGTQADFDVDTSPALAAALAFSNLSLSTGRRAVHFPAGVYVFQSAITVPSGCAIIGEPVPRAALPGDWINGNPARVNGTTFWTNASAGNAAGPAFIRLYAGAACENINVWYTGQTRVDDFNLIVAYPPTFLISTDGTGGNSDNARVRNCSALNCYDFMNIGDGTNSVGRIDVEDCYVNPYHKGVTCRSLNGDVVNFTKVFIENLFTTTPVYMPNINVWLRDHLYAFDLADSQGVNLTNCIALAYFCGVYTNSGTWCQITNCLFDYCALPGWFDGADRVMVSNTTFINNYRSGPAVRVTGNLKGLSFAGGFAGDAYSSIKTGFFCSHASGTVKISGFTFTLMFPAVLNTGAGIVELSNSGISFDRVTGDNIYIEGLPYLLAGTSLGLSTINPTFPASTGWVYSTPGNVQSIPNGIRIQGVGNNTITYRPFSVSTAENDLMARTTGLLRLTFNMLVQRQGGSPKMEVVIVDDSSVIVLDAFQITQDSSSADSGLPEGEIFRVSIPLPWSLAARQLRLQLSGQAATTVYEITNMNITLAGVPRGYTGTEPYVIKTLLPDGSYDTHTGKRILRTSAIPTAGSWSAGDRVDITPKVVGQPKRAERVTTGSSNTIGTDWISEGNL